MEKKFADEKKQRTDFQLKLEAERKNKKAIIRNYGSISISGLFSRSLNFSFKLKLEAERKIKDVKITEFLMKKASLKLTYY